MCDARFDQILDGPAPNLALEVFAWISSAPRPMTVRELQQALCITANGEIKESGLENFQAVRDLCMGFIGIQDGRVNFTHHSLQEYLAKKTKQRYPNAAERLAIACLQCIKNDDLSALSDFRAYATTNWAFHTRRCVSEMIDSVMLAILTKDPNRLIKGLSVFCQRSNCLEGEPGFQPGSGALPPLHIAATMGLIGVVTKLVNDVEGSDVNIRSANDWTALDCAVSHNHPKTTRKLLELGASITLDHKETMRTTLHLAAMQKDPACLLELFMHLEGTEEALSQNRPRYHHQSTVLYSEDPLNSNEIQNIGQAGNEKVVQKRRFIDQGDVCGVTALHLACGKGTTQIVQKLMDHGADPDVTDYFGFSPLHWAARNGMSDCAKKLITAANKDITDKFGASPLHHAIRKDHSKFWRLLIDRGASMEVKDSTGQTPASLAWSLKNIRLSATLDPLAYDLDEQLTARVTKGQQANCDVLTLKNLTGQASSPKVGSHQAS